MKLPRIICHLAGLALAAGLLTLPAGAFSDTAGHWAEPVIDKWSQVYGIIGGYEDGTFRPDNSITRGAFAGIMDRFLRFQTISPEETFSDLGDSYWKNEILKLNAAGVYLGNNGKALANSSITRQQAVTMIARAFHVEGESEELPYTDAAGIEIYAVPSVAEMTARGWITDSPEGAFRPTEPITRAEVVNIFGNMIQDLVKETGTRNQNVEGTVMISAPEGAALEDMIITGDLILAPGVTGTVTLKNVTLEGGIRNLSQVEPVILDRDPSEEPPTLPQDPVQEPEPPGIIPSEIYTPSGTTGSFIEYDGKKIPVSEGREKSRLYPGDFAWAGDRLEYIGSDFDTRFGIDVSAYQNRANQVDQTIDWDAVRDCGVEFAMVRIGLRGTSTGLISADQYYAQNIDGAMAAGIETGVYFFAQAITVEEAIEEADFVIELLKDHEINGPVAYDWEMHNASYRVYGTPPEMATACAIAFCRRVEEAGYTPMIYAGTYVSYIKYDQGAIAPYLSWYPEYKTAKSEKLYPTLYYQMDYWQFTDSCSIDGITGRVDASLQFIPK